MRSDISSSSYEKPHQSSLQQPSLGSFGTAVNTPQSQWVDSPNWASGEAGAAHGHIRGREGRTIEWNGAGEVLSFSRHSNVITLMVYRDRERNVQGQLAGLVAGGVWGPDVPSNRDYREQVQLDRCAHARRCWRGCGSHYRRRSE